MAVWSPAVALLFYFVGGLIPAFGDYTLLGALTASLFKLYSHTCHQIPERSFFMDNSQFGFCARCTGFHGGLALTMLFIVKTSRKRAISLAWLLVFCLPILFDVIFDVIGQTAAANEMRFATGLMAATAVALFIYPRFINVASKSLAPEARGD